MSSTIWLAILTALPSPTIVSSPYTTIELLPLEGLRSRRLAEAHDTSHR